MERTELKKHVLGLEGAVERSGAVFLCDAQWTPAEREAAEALMAQRDEGPAATGAGWLCVRTGGTGGQVKFARHDESTLGAAVRGFCAHFGLTRVNAIDVLPAHHVSGLMARLRCATTGGRHGAWPWKRLEAGELPEVPIEDAVISLVPTQLHRLLASPAAVDWLRRFRIIFVGGGPLGADLAARSADAALRLSPGYGLTETAAMITALRPEEFLAGVRSSGAALPHGRVEIEPREGLIGVEGGSLFRGYWPEWSDARAFTTEDLGRLDERMHLHVLGRRDAMILTGGKKVQAVEIEAVLRASGEFADVAVVGVPDAEWGEAVVACYPAGQERTPDVERAVAALAAFQRPKRFVALTEWPRNAQGKLNRAALREAASRGRPERNARESRE